MRNLLLISMLVMAPLSFASYHGGGSGDSSSGGSSGGGGYGSGSSGAAAGLLLVGGLIYFLKRFLQLFQLCHSQKLMFSLNFQTIPSLHKTDQALLPVSYTHLTLPTKA